MQEPKDGQRDACAPEPTVMETEPTPGERLETAEAQTADLEEPGYGFGV